MIMDRKKIILVEDNPGDFELIMRTFHRNNITNEIIPAHDGAEVLDYLFSGGIFSGNNVIDDIAVILLDLKLPKVSGLEVLKKIRKNPGTRTIPVVILTASKEEQDQIDSYKLGVNSYIRKPFDMQKFAESVKQLGLYWLVLNQTPQSVESWKKQSIF